MQKLIWGTVAIVAIAGWIAALVAMNRSSDLSTTLTVAEADLAALTDRLAAAQGDLGERRNSTDRLQSLNKQIDMAQAVSDALTQQAKGKRSELQSLIRKIDTRDAEYSDLASRIEAGKAELAETDQKIYLARIELDQYRTRAEQRAESDTRALTDPSAAREPQSTAGPERAPSPSRELSATEIQVTDLVSNARRRFGVIDQNGDDRIDRIEFLLRQVKALGLIDANWDGIVTIDETLLSPRNFRRFDHDGNGVISQVEFVDDRTFDAIDANRDQVVTFEEYMGLLRGN